MRSAGTLALLLLAVACGSDNDGDDAKGGGDALSGSNWVLLDIAAGCVLTLAFEDGAFTEQRGCAVAPGLNNTEVSKGTYTFSGDQLTFATAQRSCPTKPAAFAVTATIVDDKLSISSAAGARSYSRYTPTGASAASNYGCFGSDGTFTSHPLTP